MLFEPVSRKLSDLYQSIHGKNAQEKASSVAHQAFQNSPWVAIGIILTKFVPTNIQSSSPWLLHFVSATSPLAKTVSVVSIVYQLKQCSNFAKKVLETPLGFQKLYYLLLTYSTISFAYDYFKIMFLGKEKPPEEKKELHPSNFTLGLLGMSFALQLRYAPINTLAGVALGAYIRENPWVVNQLIDDYKSSFKTTPAPETPEDLKKANEDISVGLETASRWLNEEAVFSNPKTTEEKCYHAWQIWDFAARSISLNTMALRGGILQGKSLAAWIRSYFPKK